MSPEGVKQIEPILRPGHADVREAPLFFEFLGGVEAPAVWEEALLHSEHEDHRKLEAFDHVQSDQGHALRAFVQRVDIAHQRRLLEECLQPLAGR